MTRSISFSRPITGSSLPSRACWVRLRPNWSSTSDDDGAPSPRPPSCPPPTPYPKTPSRRARQQLQDLLAHPVQIRPQLDQDLGGHALTLTDQAEQDVLGADVVVAQLQRLAQRELQDLLGPRRERDVPARRLLTLPDDLLDLPTDALQGDPERLQGLRGHPLTLGDQTKEDVLGADVVVVEHPGLFLGQDDNPPRSVGEPLKHRAPRPPRRTAAPALHRVRPHHSMNRPRAQRCWSTRRRGPARIAEALACGGPVDEAFRVTISDCR